MSFFGTLFGRNGGLLLMIALLFSAMADGQERRRSTGIKAGKLGVSTGAVQIPARLKELAQQGAEAIANQKWKKARDLFHEMVLQAPGNPLALANLAVAEYQLKNYDAAELTLKKSLAINESIAQNWMTLGLIQYEKGQNLLAISSLTRAVHEDPSSAQAHLYLAAVTYDQGWTLAAIEELKRVVELEPDHAEAHFNLAMTYLGQQPPKVELARRHYVEAVKNGAQRSAEIERIFHNSSE